MKNSTTPTDASIASHIAQYGADQAARRATADTSFANLLSDIKDDMMTADIDAWYDRMRSGQQARDLKVANHIKVQADEAFLEALANGDDLDD